MSRTASAFAAARWSANWYTKYANPGKKATSQSASSRDLNVEMNGGNRMGTSASLSIRNYRASGGLLFSALTLARRAIQQRWQIACSSTDAGTFPLRWARGDKRRERWDGHRAERA
jgi:hypothetical protein